MAVETIKIIKETEAKAEEIKNEALLMQKKMISDFNSESEALKKKLQNEIKEKSEAFLYESQTLANEESKRILEEAKNEAYAIKEKARRNVSKAVEIILVKVGNIEWQ